MKSRANEPNPKESIGNGEQFWTTQEKKNKKLDIFSLSENEG